jgi:hypothetical protein
MTRVKALILGLLVIVACTSAGGVWILKSERLSDMVRSAAGFAFDSQVRWEEIASDGWNTIVVRELQLMRPDEPDTIYGTIDEVRVTLRPWRIPFRDASIVKDIELKNARGTVRWDPKTGLLDMPSPIKEEYGSTQGGSLGDIPVVRLEGLFVTLEHAPYVLKSRQELAFPGLKIDVMPDGSDRWLYRFGATLKDNPILGTFDVAGKFNAATIALSIHRPGDLVGESLREILREPDDARTAELLAGLSVKGDIGLGIDVFGKTGEASTSVGGTIRLEGASISHKSIPVRLDDIRGRLTLVDGVVTTRSLTARYEGADLNVSATVDFRPQASRLVAADVDLVGLDLGGGFADRLSRLGGATLKVKEQVDAWQPRGFANLKGRLAIPGPAATVPATPEPWLFLDLDLRKSVAVNYRGAVKEDGLRHGFPYLLSDVTGVIRFTDLDMRFDRITASHGPAFVEARGVIGYERADDETYDVDIVAQGIPIDDALNEALRRRRTRVVEFARRRGRGRSPHRSEAHATRPTGRTHHRGRGSSGRPPSSEAVPAPCGRRTRARPHRRIHDPHRRRACPSSRRRRRADRSYRNRRRLRARRSESRFQASSRGSSAARRLGDAVARSRRHAASSRGVRSRRRNGRLEGRAFAAPRRSRDVRSRRRRSDARRRRSCRSKTSKAPSDSKTDACWFMKEFARRSPANDSRRTARSTPRRAST